MEIFVLLVILVPLHCMVALICELIRHGVQFVTHHTEASVVCKQQGFSPYRIRF